MSGDFAGYREPLEKPGTPLPVEAVTVGLEVIYRRRRATVVATGHGALRDGTAIPLARLRFPRGGELIVFAAQLQGRDG